MLYHTPFPDISQEMRIYGCDFGDIIKKLILCLQLLVAMQNFYFEMTYNIG